MRDPNKLLLEIIENKYRELQLEKSTQDRFYKIKFFEGNAIGQIGEKFVKEFFDELQIPLDEERETIHDEYDILSQGRKIEIKTARQGLRSKTFQFNGINPSYNHDFIIFIGLTSVNAFYQVVDEAAHYVHQKRKYYLRVDGQNRQLVSMNPGNSVNYKLTLPLSKMKPISSFAETLTSLFKK